MAVAPWNPPSGVEVGTPVFSLRASCIAVKSTPAHATRNEKERADMRLLWWACAANSDELSYDIQTMKPESDDLRQMIRVSPLDD